MMKLDIFHLHQDVGLKYDELVMFGIEDVTNFIQKHLNTFIDLNVQPIQDSHMLYGYNSIGNPIKIGLENELIRRIIVQTQPYFHKRFVGTISYDGHLYNGFQIQTDQKTIQGELTNIVSNINGYETLVQGASRTDAGVHANNYTIHFDTIRDLSNEQWLELLNHQLPKDIFVHSVEETHPLFHSRYDVYMKKYIYKLTLNERNPFKVQYEWNIKTLDLDILRENLQQLIGTHNFLSFCKGNPDSPERTIYSAEVNVDENEIQIALEGNGFLRYMIRILVYALVQIAQKEINVTITDILNEQNRKHTKHLAPASGLYLDRITY